eukprot:2712818-Amphidinium_carterae.1
MDGLERLWLFSPALFREFFKSLVCELRWQHLRLLPHGLKRGGAIDFFRATGRLDRCLLRRKWASAARTADV